MSGPLARVDTKTAAISLDIDRKLYMGRGIILRFVVPDTTQFNNWRVVLVLTRGFNRITPDEETKGESSEVIIEVADLNGSVATIIREKDLHVELDGTIYPVRDVPPVASNEAQVYRLTCNVRTLKYRYFDNKKT